MADDNSPIKILRAGLKTALEPVFEGARAGASALGILRSGRVLTGMTLGGLAQAFASALAGDHPYGVGLAFHRANHPNKAALIQGEKILTYEGLYQGFQRASHVLDGLGVKPGDRVVLMMSNCPEWVILAAAAGNVGASLIPLATGTKGESFDYILESSRPRAVLCDGALFPNLKASISKREGLLKRTLVVGRGEPSESDIDLGEARDYHWAMKAAPKTPLPPPPDRGLFPGLVMYTSGTTGRPKGVERGESALDFGLVPEVEELLQRFGFSRDDVCLFPSPLYHSAPLLFLGAHLALGATVVLGASAKPGDLISDLQTYGITNALLVPTVLSRLVAHEPPPSPEDFPQLRAIFTTAAPLPIPTAEGIRERFGDVLHDFYGATETGIVTMASPRDLRERPGTVGRVLPGAEMHIIKEDGTPAGPGEEGELFARTALSMMGYRGNQGATAKASYKGCFTVGDKAYQDNAGFVFIAGRRSDLIISGGVNVYPAEVEATLMGHPAIAEAAVVGIEDSEWGEVVHGVLILKGGEAISDADLKEWVSTRLSKPQQPKYYHRWEAFPTSPQGKVLKREIRQRLVAHKKSTKS